jgi:carbonic anhydrase
LDLHNADNTCTRAEGSILGSLECYFGHRGTNLIMVPCRTNRGAVAGATKSCMANKAKDTALPADGKTAPARALRVLLQDAGSAAQDAHQDLGQDVSVKAVAAHAVKVTNEVTLPGAIRSQSTSRLQTMPSVHFLKYLRFLKCI